MWQSHLSYHPRIGYTFTPNFKARIPHESGGYLMRTNTSGFRSEREFVPEKPLGSFRALLFGDSQTAGLGVNNRQRYSDLLETSIPSLEVYNYGLSGSGTDQQYLAYQIFGEIDHDLLIIGMYVEDAIRVASRYLTFNNGSGQPVLFAKPYYELIDGELQLHHVPVPKRPLSPGSAQVDSTPMLATAMSSTLRRAAQRIGIADLVRKARRTQHAAAYQFADGSDWNLLSSILRQWIEQSPVPVLLLPIPMWASIERASSATGYRARVAELAHATGCLIHDPLADMSLYPAEQRRSFTFKKDKHLSADGHRALATSLVPILKEIIDRKCPRVAPII